jgi:hypothetical protein
MLFVHACVHSPECYVEIAYTAYLGEVASDADCDLLRNFLRALITSASAWPLRMPVAPQQASALLSTEVLWSRLCRFVLGGADSCQDWVAQMPPIAPEYYARVARHAFQLATPLRLQTLLSSLQLLLTAPDGHLASASPAASGLKPSVSVTYRTLESACRLVGRRSAVY